MSSLQDTQQSLYFRCNNVNNSSETVSSKSRSQFASFRPPPPLFMTSRTSLHQNDYAREIELFALYTDNDIDVDCFDNEVQFDEEKSLF